MRRVPQLPLRKWFAFLTLLVLLLGATLPLLAAPPSFRILQVEAGTSNGVPTVTLTIALTGGTRPIALRGLFFPTWGFSPAQKVEFYFDRDYPILGSLPDSLGVLDHLTPALRDRGYTGSVDTINATRLADLLTSNDTPVVVMATTVIPRPVLSNTTNLLTPWLSRGGILVWTGDLFGGFIGNRSQTTVEWNDTQNLQWAGEPRVFGSPVIAKNLTFPGNATIPTPISTWLGLRYPLAYVGAKVTLDEARGGLAMGYNSNGSDPSTSIAWIPVGSGGVLLFGYGPVLPFGYSAEDVVANDMAQILMSEIIRWDRAGAPGLLNLTLAPGERRVVTVETALPAGAGLARLYLFSIGPVPPYVFSSDIPPP